MDRTIVGLVACTAWTAACSSGSLPTDGGGTDAIRVDTYVAPDATDTNVVVDSGEDVVTVIDTGVDVAPDVPVVIGPHVGSVDRLRFGVFGDVRPPFPDQNTAYPIDIFTSVMTGIQDLGAQFAVSTGDYMNANLCTSCVNDQLDMFATAERAFSGHVFHALGNHECFTITSYNCPNENETTNIRTFRSRYLTDYDHTYYDWTIHTSLGDAHFIATAPNAWSAAQATWLDAALAIPAAYTFVLAHEPPAGPGPGTQAIEDAMSTRTGGISMRLYGHVHEYSRVGFNGTITGNAGAQLSGSGYFGFVIVEQRADGNLVVNAYEIGHPPMLRDSFVVTPDGMPTR